MIQHGFGPQGAGRIEPAERGGHRPPRLYAEVGGQGLQIGRNYDVFLSPMVLKWKQQSIRICYFSISGVAWGHVGRHLGLNWSQ